jgi:translation elongation factor EF-Tu-like GTPase
MMLEIIAKIYLLRTDEGGRRSFIFSGYRPNIRFGDDVYTDGALTFSDREKLFPGGKCQVKIMFPKPELVEKYVTVGTTFDINEGSHKVGEGEILVIPLPTQSSSAL